MQKCDSFNGLKIYPESRLQPDEYAVMAKPYPNAR